MGVIGGGSDTWAVSARFDLLVQMVLTVLARIGCRAIEGRPHFRMLASHGDAKKAPAGQLPGLWDQWHFRWSPQLMDSFVEFTIASALSEVKSPDLNITR